MKVKILKACGPGIKIGDIVPVIKERETSYVLDVNGVHWLMSKKFVEVVNESKDGT